MARRMIESRKRGIFGWFFISIFWAWNALMAYSLFGGMMSTSEHYASLTNEAERAGAAIGSGIGITMILLIWTLGAVLFGLLAYFSRGRKEIIELEV